MVYVKKYVAFKTVFIIVLLYASMQSLHFKFVIFLKIFYKDYYFFNTSYCFINVTYPRNIHV